MSADRTIAKEEIAVLLASALGQHKSDEVIATTARSLGIARSAFTGDDVRAIFDELQKVEGLVGVVARFAVSRRDVDRLIAKATQVSPQQLGRPDFAALASGPQVPAPRTATVDILPLIVPALGVEKARDAIEAAAARCGVDIATGLSHSGALLVLDEMTKVEGIVGVVARFGKARFLLEPGD